MTELSPLKWNWPAPLRGHPSVGADQKAFRSIEIRQLGDLADDRVENRAAIFAREAIQNARDAAIDLQSKLQPGVASPPFEIQFCFSEVSGDEKERLVKMLDLERFAGKIDAIGADNLDYPIPHPLKQVGDPGVPMRILRVSEQGTTGMYGSIDRNDSKMLHALMSSQVTDKSGESGGSFGYGKAGLVKASGSKIVLAYSCFAPGCEDKNVDRRFLGISYWTQFRDNDGNTRLGWGQLGQVQDDSGVIPYENEEADQIAQALGITPRTQDGDGLNGPGTDFVIIEPVIQPNDLRRAIERFWWPALMDQSRQIDFSVFDYNGDELAVHPRLDPLLADFMDAYQIAMEADAQERPSSLDPAAGVWDWQRKIVTRKPRRTLGGVGLISNVNWAWQNQTIKQDERVSLVALVRNTGMVIEYRRSGGERGASKTPFVRGAFLADAEISSHLRRTESLAHDTWKTTPDADEAERPEVKESFDLARGVLKWIDQDVKDFQKLLRPPETSLPDSVSLPFLDKLFGGRVGGRGPVKVSEPELKRQHHQIETDLSNPGLCRLRSKFIIGIQDSADISSANADVQISIQIVEDGAARGNFPAEIKPPEGFTAIEAKQISVTIPDGTQGFIERTIPARYKFTGSIEKGQLLEFQVVTEGYDPDWTIRPHIEYTLQHKD